jgi:hypothetical protein
MKKRLLRVAAVAFVLAAGASRAALGAPPEAGARVQAAAVPQPPLTRDQIAQFLKTAKVIGHKGISRGVTNPARLTLSDGTLTHDAAFSRVNEHKPIMQFPGGRTELDFVDSYKYTLAANEIAELLGIEDMFPVTVEREWDHDLGALSWWLDDMMLEGERLKQQLSPPDAEDWAKQQYTMRVFTQLVDDTDRNVGNILIDKAWKIYLIDFTRAFRRPHELRAPQLLQRCDKNLLAKLRDLKVEDVKARISKWVPAREIESMMARRDALVALYDKLIAERGEARVLF